MTSIGSIILYSYIDPSKFFSFLVDIWNFVPEVPANIILPMK